MARKSSVERANEIAGGFATAKKNIVVQFGSKERATDDILSVIKSDMLSKGFKDADFDKVDVYIKPEEQKIFYVVNDTVSGSIDF
ncbi:MAG: DUF6465 family protein [Butyrivibrio sp.]|uniref:DUF6465 family protein n=1 Tax=Butyrivibrio sp. TaxID=28121 RepID=UPI0025F710B5|nr:DUF6465 family protein [Butyrivibrio sp.]MCR5772189.1 DUF6465 family protein [Butyrivibrio sp.]